MHVRPGDPLINLHVWNEQFPSFPAFGPTLAWASRFNRAFDTSLRELAHFLGARRDLDDVKAICAKMAFAPTDRSAQLTRFVSRFGFEKIPVNSSRSLRQRMQRLGENILVSMIVLAHNAAALRADTLWRDRTVVFLSRQILQRRYGFVRDQAAGSIRHRGQQEPDHVAWQAITPCSVAKVPEPESSLIHMTVVTRARERVKQERGTKL